jgi:hypothetical protein
MGNLRFLKGFCFIVYFETIKQNPFKKNMIRKKKIKNNFMMPETRFELVTQGFSVLCSTN